MAEKINVRSVALALLSEYEEQGKYVNLSLNSHKADKLSDSERGQLTALLYTTVEHKLTYDYYIASLSGRSIDKIDSTTKNILRLGLCQLFDMSGIPTHAAVNETVELCRAKTRGFVNAVLRSYTRQKQSIIFASTKTILSLQNSKPIDRLMAEIWKNSKRFCGQSWARKMSIFLHMDKNRLGNL